MDLYSPLSLVTFNICFMFFIFALVRLLQRSHGTPIPGPWKLPLLGSMHHLFGSIPPHQILRDMARKHGPVMHIQLGEISLVVISTLRLAKEVLNMQEQVFLSRHQILVSEIVLYNSKDILFSPHDEYWKLMRKTCLAQLLSTKKVRSFSSIRGEEVTHMVEYIHSTLESPINLSKLFFEYANAVVCRTTFGKRCKHQDAIIPLIREVVSWTGGMSVADLFPSWKLIQFLSGTRRNLERLRCKVDKILDIIINERKEILQANALNKEPDCDSTDEETYLLDVLLMIEEERGSEVHVTTNDIKGVIMDMFMASTDTSSGTIDWAMLEMVRNREVMEKAQAEVRQVLKGKKQILETDVEGLSYLKMVIKETLRMHPPGALYPPRICSKECQIGGYIIPANAKVTVNAWAIARDPAYWNDPDSFQPERFQEDGSFDFAGNHNEYIPFGTGRRMCPGIHFGLANVVLALAQLLYYFNWQLPGGTNSNELDDTLALGLTSTREKELYLVASSHTFP